jgi:thioredoxin-related protein
MKYPFFILLLFVGFSAFAQTDSIAPPYKRFPTLPPIQLLLGDSATRYIKDDLPKKKPLFIMLFSPDCSHCQHTAEEIVKYKDDLKNVQIVMATMQPLWRMNEFAETYHLKELPNVVIGRDVNYVMPVFYAIKNLPYMAFYNKKGNLISIYEGSLDISRVIQIFKSDE